MAGHSKMAMVVAYMIISLLYQYSKLEWITRNTIHVGGGKCNGQKD